MIDDPPVLTIRRSWPRPSATTIARFAGAPTSFVVDALGGRGALDWRIKPIPGTPPAFVGAALPCRCGPADNLAVAAAVGLARGGDVILAASDGFTGTAVVGDLIVGMMKNRGVAAFVTDGLVRDLVDLQTVGLPCFAMGLTPNSPMRNGPGAVALPTVVGGLTVEPGDIVVGDADGVAVVPLARADEIAAALDAVRTAETAAAAKVKAGLDAPGHVADLLASAKVRWVE
jgi:4-hydroxy-4-methyl-2-oxoglutarate aldolase